MRYNSTRRRAFLLTFYTLITLSVLLITAFTSFRVMFSHGSFDDRISATSDVLTAGTLLLAVVAGFIALQAFGVSTGLPKLQIQVWFDSSDKNRPMFMADPAANGWLRTNGPTGQTIARLRIRNQSIYPARDVAMVIELNGMTLVKEAFRESIGWWSADALDDTGIRAVQWDGGSDFVIHGHSIRRVPDLDCGTILFIMDRITPYLEVHLIASPGYRRSVQVPVIFITESNSQVASSNSSINDRQREWL